MWTSGLLDAVPPTIDHAVVGAAAGLGRNGWGGALLLRDVSEHLVPEGDDPLSLEDHRQLLDHLADLSATFWGAEGTPELLSLESRWSAFGPGWMAAEEALGWPDAVPRIARDGWARFAERAPADVLALVDGLRHDIDPLVRAVRQTPLTFLHGDWKLGNLGVAPGRTVLLDWTYPGIGPIAHDLAWYLSLNRARLPESKEESIDALRALARAPRHRHRRLVGARRWSCACSARWCSSAGRRRSATTTSSAGGATGPGRGRAACEPRRRLLGHRRRLARRARARLPAPGRRPRRRVTRSRWPASWSPTSAPAPAPPAAPSRGPAAARSRSTWPTGCSRVDQRRAAAGRRGRRAAAAARVRLVRGGRRGVLVQPRPRPRARARPKPRGSSARAASCWRPPTPRTTPTR